MAKKTGRPSKYTRELAHRICERLASGETLNAICRDDGMPRRQTVLGWALDNEEFAPLYKRAREIGYSAMADDILDISDDASKDIVRDGEGNARTDHEAINRSRLKVDTRKWLMSKALPKVYGDKLQVGGPDGGALSLEALVMQSYGKKK